MKLLFLLLICASVNAQTDTLRKTYTYEGTQYRELYLVKHSDVLKAKASPNFSWSSWSVPATMNLYSFGSDGKWYLIERGINQPFISSSQKIEGAPPQSMPALKRNHFHKR